eukprot:363399-Chlamydomonas_euryale.AAC.1
MKGQRGDERAEGRHACFRVALVRVPGLRALGVCKSWRRRLFNGKQGGREQGWGAAGLARP